MADPSRIRLKTGIFSLIVILSNAFGNYFLTVGMRNQPAFVESSPLSYIRAIFSPLVALGIILLILWMLSRMTLLSWADLSYVLPVTALGYVATALIGRFLLGEQLSARRIAGTLFIIAGTVVVGFTRPSTTVPQESRG